mgnify:FL=1
MSIEVLGVYQLGSGLELFQPLLKCCPAIVLLTLQYNNEFLVAGVLGYDKFHRLDSAAFWAKIGI